VSRYFYKYKKSYLKDFDSFDPVDQELIVSTVQSIREFLEGGHASKGLGLKKLYNNGQEQIFEGRVNLSLRIVWVHVGQEVIFIMIGDHNRIRKFLKNI